MNTKAIGDIAEQRAAEYLASKGYKILERNAVYGDCEVDIICEARFDEEGKLIRQSRLGRLLERVFKLQPNVPPTLVFCEVKSRVNNSYGSGAEAVSPYKAGRYMTAAKIYQAAHCRNGAPTRFDIIEISGEKLEHIADAFNENDAKYPRR